MKIEPFHLERYFARHEFCARWLVSSSDCESTTLAETLAWADEECGELWRTLRLGYTETRGLPALRREIAGLYAGVGENDILEVVPEEGILLAITALLERGDQVIVMHPGYQSLHGIAEAMGCDVSRWQPGENESGWEFSLDFVREKLRPTTRLVVVNFPHNPTGFLPSRAHFDELLSLVGEAGAYLFSDEMYRGLEHDPAARLPSACERYERAVSLCGMSKTYSMPGLRVGWLATRDRDLYGRLAAHKDYTTICGSAPSEVLALIGLRNRERIVARNLALIEGNLRRLDALVEARPELLAWTRPGAGSIGLARLHAPEGARAFCERLVREAGVMLLPSSVYGFGDAHVRLGFGRAGFSEGLDAIDRWLDGRPCGA